MNIHALTNLLFAAAGIVSIATSPIVFAQDASPSADAVSHALGGKEYSPYVGRNYPTQVLWGDQHTHTAISVDAGTMCRLGQDDAYRFARGEEVTATTGTRAKLSRPLDWLVIADHSPVAEKTFGRYSPSD